MKIVKKIRNMESDDIIVSIFILILLVLIGFLIYMAITSPYVPRKIRVERRVVYRTQLIGKSQSSKKVLYESGEKDTFGSNSKGFFLEKGDTVVYSDECTPWMSVDKIIFKH